MGLATVKYQYGAYTGEITVSADNDADDNDIVIARAKRALERKGLLCLQMAYESFEVVGRD